MAVFRVEKNRNYTVMSNYHLRDRNLSLRSIALLSIMLSLPEDWDYSLRGLAAICKDGRDAIGTSLKELERCGYLTREQKRDAHGRLSDIEYTVYEYPNAADQSPCPENPDTVIPDTDCPDTGSPNTDRPDPVRPYTAIPPQRNKDIYNKDILKTEIKNDPSTNPAFQYGLEGQMDRAFVSRNHLKTVLQDNIGLDFIISKNKNLDRQLEEGMITVEAYEAEYADPNTADYLLDIMTDCIAGPKDKPVKINGEDIPRDIVIDRLMKVDKGRFLAVLRMIKENGAKIRNKKAYLISALYNEGPPFLN